MRILRVFPRETSYSPHDGLAEFGPPGLFRPEADEVHVSVTFTWDKAKGEELARQWEPHYPGKVRLGGPAYQSDCSTFYRGRYVKDGITYTTRGCPNRCPFCLVPEWEGDLRVLDNVAPGHTIQDNNFLAAPKAHRAKVYDMLRNQHAVRFLGGLESRRFTGWDALQMEHIKINELWFACDSPGSIRRLRKALGLIPAMPRNKKRCYVLIGFRDGETVDDAEARLREVWHSGALPFAQLYRPPAERDKTEWPEEWRKLQRIWTRPALTKAYMAAEAR